jgi:hypothetical protein
MCPNEPDVLDGSGLFELTTAYFDFTVTDFSCDPPQGKCVHRHPFVCPATGLDKDFVGTSHHGSAITAAETATIDYVNQILDHPDIANNEDAIKELMDAEPSVAFVVDTSSNMDFSNPSYPPVLTTVQEAIVNSVIALAASDHKPSSYILVSFNDTGVGEIVETDNENAFIVAVQELEAPTEYCEPVFTCDCVGYAGGAVEKAVTESTADGTVYLFTTLHPVDPSALGRAVATAADSGKRVRIHPILMWADSDSHSLGVAPLEVAVRLRQSAG